MDSLENVSDELKELYRRHYETIRTRVTRGRIKNVYHFLMTEQYTTQLINGYLAVIQQQYEYGYKLNAAFGFILENTETEELKFFHPSNNNMLFETPKLIQNEQDIKDLLEELEKQDVWEYANAQRPSTKWLVVKIVCMRFDVYKIN